MDTDRLDRIRQHLMDRRKSLIASLDRRRAAGEEASRNEPRDEGDESVRLDAQDEAWRQAEADTREIARIDAALARMREDSYGECVDCGEEIEEKRLIALPTAARCMSCQEGQEQAARQPSL